LEWIATPRSDIFSHPPPTFPFPPPTRFIHRESLYYNFTRFVGDVGGGKEKVALLREKPVKTAPETQTEPQKKRYPIPPAYIAYIDI
jgi:hypothetical protein